ncbi:exo-beta-N-acetylmuramidase NamZ family protein [Desulfogranum mediterraneum]|uniref:exo-beta-N-acetylmuramidase NamZ family protein n=1 Tax=Desulfogranum mediterraneum TaxID=160661 RepID=UPI000429978C|nr:DUF1343 domain-containing protein [Desulfogranum mediterraneum]
MITIGIERLCQDSPDWLEGKRLGLLSNQASTDRNFVHSRDRLIQAFPGQLTTMFSPQHGFFCEKQDNMIESDHAVDPHTGLRVYSLYGETRKPYPEMFSEIDLLLVDLVDVGTRVYTFIWTLVHCLEVAAATGVEVAVLDRPNPINGQEVEGNLLEPDCRSFVGLCSIPMRHGLTMGELARFCNLELAINARLRVVPMQGWRREMYFAETGFPWVFPSPNMPTAATALVYPGQVLWEGTMVSEGRGTTMPFEIFGAPYLSHQEVLELLDPAELPGCLLRPLVFEPTSGKWAGQGCVGFQLHVSDQRRFKPYRTSLILLQALLRLYPQDFSYKEPPYEYEYERLPMDMIIGSEGIRRALEEGVAVSELERSWQQGLNDFERKRAAVFLYDG